MNKSLSLKKSLVNELQQKADSKKAALLQRYFKTGKGEYGEGDIFLGLTVPIVRDIAKAHKDISIADLQSFIGSKFHEYREVALFILIIKYESAVKDKRQTEIKKIISFYCKNLKYINNWDLVDLSAPKILGHYYFDKDRSYLYKLSDSKNLWYKRIAILATFYFIKNNQFTDSFNFAKKYLNDSHDLIHKSTGWMLREIGKKDLSKETNFLRKYHKRMPRTMFRYAIEKFDSKQKSEFVS